MLKHWMETVHNHDNGYHDWLFYQNVFPQRSQLPQCLSMAKDSHLRDYFAVYSLNSEQVFLSVQLKIFSKFSGWTSNFFFFASELYYSLFL